MRTSLRWRSSGRLKGILWADRKTVRRFCYLRHQTQSGCVIWVKFYHILALGIYVCCVKGGSPICESAGAGYIQCWRFIEVYEDRNQFHYVYRYRLWRWIIHGCSRYGLSKAPIQLWLKINCSLNIFCAFTWWIIYIGVFKLWIIIGLYSIYFHSSNQIYLS